MKFVERLVALAALAAATPAFATNLVTNGSFEDVTVGGKSYFAGNVTGWSGGTNLTFIAFPGTADDGSYLSVYPGFPTVSPAGGNFVLADGDPTYSSAISQTINGLTVGAKYAVSFYQAAGQQLGFTGPTTERWQVTFGDETQLSSMFSLPQGATGPWEKVNMMFTATSASQTLSFLAVGTPGGAPPISFLDGVSVSAAPESATWLLMIVGLGMIGVRIRSRKQNAQAFA